MRTAIVMLVCVVSTTWATACSSSGDTGGTPNPPPTTGANRPASTGVLKIVSPKNGEMVKGSTVDLKVKLTGAKLVPATTGDIKPDEGHLHVSLDGKLISMTEGVEQKIPNLTPGNHTIEVEFVASDHVPFDPRVISGVVFEVKG
jgi:hypothetical protein